MSDKLRATIKKVIYSAITTYLDKKGEPETRHVILDRIFPAERRIRSIIGGLETSMGTKVWERLPIEIAGRNGFTINANSSFTKPKFIPPRISQFITEANENRKSNPIQFQYDEFVNRLRAESRLIVEREHLEYCGLASGDGIDLWIEKNGQEYIFDFKTVQINAGDGNHFAHKMMEWLAYRLIRDPEVEVQVALVFPYSPFPPFTADSWWKEQKGRAEPLQRGKDALVQEEFWNLIGGANNVWPIILDVMDELAEELNPRYRHLFYPDTKEMN
tara:strand:- start:880 stop:1701 length:822 start_codon:yes stop_codon:yes gene_type:complete